VNWLPVVGKTYVYWLRVALHIRQKKGSPLLFGMFPVCSLA